MPSALRPSYMAEKAFPATNPSQGHRHSSPCQPARVPSPNLTAEDRAKRLQAGLLAFGSFYSPPLPVLEIALMNSGLRGFRPRSQRRVRSRFSRASLSEACSDIPATESYALASWASRPNRARNCARPPNHTPYYPRHVSTMKSMQKTIQECKPFRKVFFDRL